MSNLINYLIINKKIYKNNTIEDLDNNTSQIKTVNYLELIPIMISKMKIMQKEIDELNIRLENIGLEKVSLQEFKQIIECKDRNKAGFSVPAHGLYLTKVEYPYL